MKPKQSNREIQYSPQAGKTLREALRHFITREFPRLGGPWIVELFVDKLLEFVDKYYANRDNLKPGQVLWPAIDINEFPAYRKSTYQMKQVPVVINLITQDDIADLRKGVKWAQILKKAIVRAANDAYSQGGLLTTTDLSILFYHSHSRVADLICQYETETNQMVPRRGNIHDIGRTVTHKRIICRKAFLEGKPTHVIAQETQHSPEAVDSYILDFSRVYFATVQCNMSVDETVFAIQKPRYLVENYVELIKDFGLNEQQVFERSKVKFDKNNEDFLAVSEEETSKNKDENSNPSQKLS